MLGVGNFYRKAEAGIGTLILFIAMILVAAIAAGVLVQSTSSLQSKALLTGSRAQAQVSSQAMAIYVYGKDGTSIVGGEHVINRTFMKMKLAPGSDPINLESSLIQVDTDDSKASLTYSNSINCSIETADAGGIFNSAHVNNYGARTLIGNDDEYIERSDVVELCFALPGSVKEGRNLRITFSPKVGNPTVVETKTPDVMLDQQVRLFP